MASSSSSSPLQRAQAKFRPILKPKSPLRRQSVCNVPGSPSSSSSLSNISPSSSSSLSGHGGHSSSASGGKHAAPAPAQLQVGSVQLSLPLLVVAGVSVFVAALVMRAVYTFGTSLVRLFILLLVVMVVLTFSQLNDKQALAAEKKKQEAAAAAAAPASALSGDGRYYSSKLDDKASHSASLAAAAAYARGYSNGAYAGGGHVKYGSTNTPLHSPPPYSSDGRSRQLLSAHQSYSSYH